LAYPVEEKTYLLGKDSKFVSVSQVPIQRTKELRRRWPKIKDKLVESCIKALDEYCDAGNASPQYYVIDPVVTGPRGKVTWEGTWRNVHVGRTGDPPQGIEQVLRLGFIQHSGNAADPIDEDEARLGGTRGLPGTRDLHAKQEWRYCDPADHEEIVEDLNAIENVTTPKVEGETMSGLYACSQVGARQNDDGSVLIHRDLTQMETVDEPSDLTNMFPLISRQEEIINAFGFQTGDEEKSIYIFTHVSPASETYCMETITPAQLITALPGAGWVFVDRKFDVKLETGVAVYIVLFMKETWAAQWQDDRRIRSGSSLSGERRNISMQRTGMSKADAEEAYETNPNIRKYNKGDVCQYDPGTGEVTYICVNPTSGPWTAADWVEADYLLNGHRIEERGRGEYVLSATMGPAYRGTVDADALAVRIRSELGGVQTALLQRVWWRRTDAAKDTLMTAGSGRARLNYTYEGVAYTHSDAVVEDHGDGAYTVRQTLVFTSSLVIYWSSSFKVYKNFSRTKDDKTKYHEYTRHITNKPTEKSGWDWIEDFEAGAPGGPIGDIVSGSEQVTKVNKYMWRAKVLVLDAISNWT
jgi:hypothetical protein